MDQEMFDKISSLIASQSVLLHLSLAIFDAVEDKTKIIEQFTKTVTETYRLSLASQPKSFLSTFDDYYKTILKSLVEPKAQIGPGNAES